MKVKDELKELRDKDLKTLFKLLKEENESAIKDKTALVEKKLKDIKGVNKRQKKIARIWTVIREKTVSHANTPRQGGESARERKKK